jgi:hypothetical protein
MKYKIYLLKSPLSAKQAVERVKDLLKREGVQHRTEGLSIVSISTPIAVLSFQRVLYSKRNWVGLNPFTFISGVDVRCRPDKSGLTEVTVQVNRFRTFLYVAFWGLGRRPSGISYIKPDGATLTTVVGLTAWFGLVWCGLV